MEQAQRPPCREADRCLASCPKCNRTMQARWLQYSHQCSKSWDVQKRGEEHAERAQKAFLARVAAEATATPGKKSYGNLFAGLR
jgi:hypothetical protein